MNPCNMARLLSAIFQVETETILDKWGLQPHCPRCDTMVHKVGYCSGCAEDLRSVPVACSFCGTVTERPTWELLHQRKLHPAQEQFFCTKRCQGKWLAEHHGFTAHPENCGPGRSRRHDYDAVWQTHLETGYGCYKLSRMLGIPRSTVTSILCWKRKEISSLKVEEA